MPRLVVLAVCRVIGLLAGSVILVMVSVAPLILSHCNDRGLNKLLGELIWLYVSAANNEMLPLNSRILFE